MKGHEQPLAGRAIANRVAAEQSSKRSARGAETAADYCANCSSSLKAELARIR